MRHLTLVFALTVANLFAFAGNSNAQYRKVSYSTASKTSTTLQKAKAEAKLIADVKTLTSHPFILMLAKENAAEIQRLSPTQMVLVTNPELVELHPIVQAWIVDNLNDFIVEWAEPFEGKSEFVLDVIYAGESTWSRYHRFDWCGSVDHGSPCDQGEQVFSSHRRADNKGEDLLDEGDIIDFRVVERPLTPDWLFVARYDTLGEAETAADAVETAAAILGEERVVRIRMVPASE